MSFYFTGKNKIYYETVGDKGPCLLLLNGYTRSSSDFRLLAKKLSAHAIRLLLVDNPGSGHSTAEASFTFEETAENIAAIAAECGMDKMAVLGISMGGVLAQCLALRYPHLLSGLVLVSTSQSKEAFQKIRPWPEDLATAQESLAPLVSPHFRRHNALLFQALCKNIWQRSQEEGFRHNAEAQRQALHRYLAQERSLGGLVCPTLIIHGELDAIIPCQEGRDMQQAIPHARLHLLADAGHLLLVEKPIELQALVVAFMNPHVSEGAPH